MVRTISDILTLLPHVSMNNLPLVAFKVQKRKICGLVLSSIVLLDKNINSYFSFDCVA